MATYNFSPDGALDAGSELLFVTQKLEEALGDLQTKVAQFLAANQGDTIANYSDAQTMWDRGQAEMNSAMGAGIQALDQIAHDYVLADNRGAMVFGQLL
jgi:uncharacterized protein YukE